MVPLAYVVSMTLIEVPPMVRVRVVPVDAPDEVERRAHRGHRNLDGLEDGLGSVDELRDAKLARPAGRPVEAVVIPEILEAQEHAEARRRTLSVEMKSPDADWFAPVRAGSVPDIVAPSPFLSCPLLDHQFPDGLRPTGARLAGPERIGIARLKSS